LQKASYRIFVKFLFSYLIILLLPITIIILIVYSSFVNKLQEEVISGNMNTLDKIRYAMDEQLKRTEDITKQLIIEDNSLYQYRISDQWGYKTWGITRELKRLQKLSPFIHEIWVYYKGEEHVFSSNGLYALTFLSGPVYRFEDWPEAKLSKDLSETSGSVVLSPAQDVNSGERFMRMLVPMFPNQKQSYGTIVYLIKESSLRQLMSTYETVEGSTWIFDQSNQLVTSMAGEKGPSTEALSELAAGGTLKPHQQLEIEGKQYYLFTVRSEQSGWSYTKALPVDVVMHKVEQAQHLFVYGIGGILLCGGIIIFFSMRWNYRPIHRLRKESIQVLSLGGNSLNELETVRYALNYLARQNKELDQRVKSHSPVAKKHLLLSLLKGDFTSPVDLMDYSREAGCPVDCSHTRVLIVNFTERVETKRLPTIEEMEGSYGGSRLLYGMEHFEPNRYVFMMFSSPSSSGLLKEELEQLHRSLSSITDATVTISVGTETVVGESPRSYLEAQTAMDYRFIQGLNRVICYEDIPMRTHEGEAYPHRETEMLLQAIRQENPDKIKDSVSAIVSQIRLAQPPLVIARGLCFDMIRLVNGIWIEKGLNDQYSTRYPDIFLLDRLETLDEFEKLLHAVSTDLCTLFGRQEAPDEKLTCRSIESMFRYIQEHYDKCDFSLQGMSEHFGMALSNMSLLFKEKTGQTPLEYATDLRMEKAKSILESTLKPLKVVSEEVGYYNVSSFIRRFKQLTGMTPGEYRTASGGQGTE
jgi:two-component system, response regulator YesN